jgi:voltage-gated potassium channel
MGRYRNRFILLLAYVIALLIIGTVGFALLPPYSLSDALYMTVITLTAVGYNEVHPLTDTGRALAALLLVGGLTGMGLYFALITSMIVEMDLAHVFRTRRTMKNIDKMKNHIVVCGAGRTGRQVIFELISSKIPYVVIERDPERADLVRELDEEALVLEEDATHDESLVESRIGQARGLVAALSADTDNLFVCLTARDLQPNLTIVARAFDAKTMNKLYTAGANHVVSPNISGGIRMASLLLRPQVMTFLDVVTRGGERPLLLEEVLVPEGSPLLGSSLAEAKIPEKTGLIVIAIRHGDERRGTFLYNPGPDEMVREGDVLIVLGNSQQIDKLRDALSA